MGEKRAAVTPPATSTATAPTQNGSQPGSWSARAERRQASTSTARDSAAATQVSASTGRARHSGAHSSISATDSSAVCPAEARMPVPSGEARQPRPTAATTAPARTSCGARTGPDRTARAAPPATAASPLSAARCRLTHRAVSPTRPAEPEHGGPPAGSEQHPRGQSHEQDQQCVADRLRPGGQPGDDRDVATVEQATRAGTVAPRRRPTPATANPTADTRSTVNQPRPDQPPSRQARSTRTS